MHKIALPLLLCFATAAHLLAAQAPAPAKKLPPIYGLENTRQQPVSPRLQNRESAPRPGLPPAPVPSLDIVNGSIIDILRVGNGLDLTEEQQRSLQQLQAEFQAKAVEMNSRARALRMSISDELKKVSPDYAAVKEQLKVLVDLQYQFRLTSLDSYESSYRLLTPRQKGLFKNFYTSGTSEASRNSGSRIPEPVTPAGPRLTAPSAVPLTPPEED